MLLPVRHIPRDVQTRWNSTFLLLLFVLKYREAIERFTGDKENKVRQFELDEEEWVLVAELCKVLKVRTPATKLNRYLY